MAKQTMGCKMEINPSFYRKLGLDRGWDDFFSEVLDLIMLKIEEFCRSSPEDGGAPVDTGLLSGSTTSDLSEKLTKYLTNNVEYWVYVVYGTSKQSANNFPLRAYNKIISENWIQNFVSQKLSSINHY